MKSISCRHYVERFLVLVLFFTCLQIVIHRSDCLGMGSNPEPTVTVIDEETGKPIEGAVAIAIWRKPSWAKGAGFEGGVDEVTRIEETVSDSNGNIYIRGFWSWHLFGYDPHLNIYKPGYVCWDQKVVYIDRLHKRRQTDFDNGGRIAHMRRWPEGFSFEGHRIFVDSLTRGDYMRAPEQMFNKAFDYEILHRVEERKKKIEGTE